MNIGDSERTIALTPGATNGVRFDGMTSNGEEVFFSSAEYLTGEDEQHCGADIFMWSRKGEEEGNPLTLISTGTEGDAGSCDPVANTLHKHWNTTGAQSCGDVAIGGGGGVASGDGTIYFLSPSLLDGTEEPQTESRTPPTSTSIVPGRRRTLSPPWSRPSLGRCNHVTPCYAAFGTLNTPTFVAVDDSGGPSSIAIYAVEGTNTIYKFAPDGSLVTGWRESRKTYNGGYPAIHGIATDPSNGDLYIAQLNEIRVLTKEGAFIRSFNAPLYSPDGIAVDPAGNVYFYTATIPTPLKNSTAPAKSWAW